MEKYLVTTIMYIIYNFVIVLKINAKQLDLNIF